MVTQDTGLTFDIRVVELEGNPWFVAADVCRALFLDNPSYVCTRLASDEKASFKLPNQRGSAATVIAESSLYKLVLRSDKPQARQFQDWVTREVLPAIRKDGAYVMGEEKVRLGLFASNLRGVCGAVDCTFDMYLRNRYKTLSVGIGLHKAHLAKVSHQGARWRPRWRW